MPYSEQLAARVRSALNSLPESSSIVEKKMFGGLCYLHNGNMCCGVEKNRLMVRCGKMAYDEALQKPHCHEMDFTGRPMRGMVMIEHDGLIEDSAIQEWIQLGLQFTATLPPK